MKAVDPRKFKKIRIGLGIFWGLACVSCSAVALVEAGRNEDDSANLSAVFDKAIHGEEMGAKTLESFSVTTTRYRGESKSSEAMDALFRPGDSFSYSYEFSPVEAKTDVAITLTGEGFVLDRGLGKVNAVGDGEAKISFIPSGRADKEVSFSLRCASIPVTSVTFASSSLELPLGEKAKLEPTVLPEDASDKSLTFVSDHPEIVSVDENGEVHGLAPGKAIIQAISKSSPQIRAEITVNCVYSQGHFSLVEEDLQGYPNEPLRAQATYQLYEGKYEPRKLSWNVHGAPIEVQQVSLDPKQKRVAFAFTYTDASLTEETSFPISLSYGSKGGRYVDELILHIHPLTKLNVLPSNPDVLPVELSFNSAYGETPLDADAFTLEWEYENLNPYAYDMSEVSLSCSAGLEVLEQDYEKGKLSLTEPYDPARSYYVDFQAKEGLVKRFELNLSLRDEDVLLSSIDLVNLLPMDDSCEPPVNELSADYPYGEELGKNALPEPFASEGLKAVISGSKENAPIVHEDGVVDLSAIQGTGEEGLVTLHVTSVYEEKRNQIHASCDLLLFFAKIDTCDRYAVTSSLWEGEIEINVEAQVAPLQPFSLNYLPYNDHRVNGSYHGERLYPSAEVICENLHPDILRYDELSGQVMPIQTGVGELRFHSPQGPSSPFVLTVCVEGEALSLEGQAFVTQESKHYQDNAMAADGSYSAVGSHFSASIGLPENLVGQKVEYVSLTPDIVSVSPSGDCVALSKGTAQIEAHLKENPAVSTSFSIQVHDSTAPLKRASSMYQGLKTSTYKDESQGLSLTVGIAAVFMKERISVTFDLGCSARQLTYRYRINDKGVLSNEIAQVDAEGNVTFLKEGNAIIEVVLGEGTPYEKSVLVGYRVRTTLASSTAKKTRKQWGHLLLFFTTVGCGLLCFFCLPLWNWVRYASEIFMPLYGFGLAWWTEEIQRNTPGRAFSYDDIWLDTRGGLYAAAIGLVIYLTIFLVKFIKKRKKGKSSPSEE